MFWSPSVTPEDVLMHSTKGTSWKKHKYIRKEGDRYIYKEDDLSGAAQRMNTYSTAKDEDMDEHGIKKDSRLGKDLKSIDNNPYALNRKNMPEPGDEDELDYAYKSKMNALATGWAYLDDKSRDIIRKKYENKESAKLRKKRRITAADRKRLY